MNSFYSGIILETISNIFTSGVESVMAVVMAPPDSGPHISGVSPSYHVDQSISATCSTSNSFPATNILWYINSQNIIIKNHQNIINKNQLFDTKSNIDIYDLRSYCKVYFRSYKSLNDKFISGR